MVVVGTRLVWCLSPNWGDLVRVQEGRLKGSLWLREGDFPFLPKTRSDGWSVQNFFSSKLEILTPGSTSDVFPRGR